MKRRIFAGASWDLAPGEIVLRRDPETGTKNCTVRRVPKIPDALALFERMCSERANESPNDKVFRVNEAPKAIDNAAAQATRLKARHFHLKKRRPRDPNQSRDCS
jgi:hypothetical protein